MKDKTKSYDVTDLPYISNPALVVKASYSAFRIMVIEFLKLFWISIGVYLIALIPAIVGAISIHDHQASLSALGLIALSIFLILVPAIYFNYALIKLTLAAARGVSMPWKKSLPPNLPVAIKVLTTLFLAGIIVFAGLLFFIIPGIFFALWFSQVQFVAVDEDIYGFEALTRSKQLVKNRLMDMTGIYGLGQVIQAMADIKFFGPLLSIVYTVITLPMNAIRFVQLTQLSETDRKDLPTNAWNYIFFWLGLLTTLILTGISIYISIPIKH